MSRSRILGGIRKSSGGGPELPAERPSFPASDDRVERFRRELEAAGGVLLDGRNELASALEELLQQTGAGEIYWDSERLFARHDLGARLRDPGAFERGRLVYSSHPDQQVRLPLRLSSRKYDRSLLAEALLSVSDSRCAIAETGTVVHAVADRGGRLLSFLPAAQAFMLRERDVLANQADFFASLDPDESASAMVLVTGPSRTADIEKTLVTGVHGPAKMFVLLTGGQ